jgi:ABC-type multidrug transport system fused ATPase/permease subunit
MHTHHIVHEQVGPSGDGKSTMTKLLLRFYDPISGCIRLDGTDIREFNLNWYRQQIGYVGK